LHFPGFAISSRANDSPTLDPGGSALFHSRVFAGVGWILCDIFCFGLHCRTLPTHGQSGASTGTSVYFTDSVRRGF
jgi:hypothetical protein